MKKNQKVDNTQRINCSSWSLETVQTEAKTSKVPMRKQPVGFATPYSYVLTRNGNVCSSTTTQHPIDHSCCTEGPHLQQQPSQHPANLSSAASSTTHTQPRTQLSTNNSPAPSRINTPRSTASAPPHLVPFFESPETAPPPKSRQTDPSSLPSPVGQPKEPTTSPHEHET